MSDSPEPPSPLPITPERIEALRAQLRRRPILYRSTYRYPPHPGLSWVERLP